MALYFSVFLNTPFINIYNVYIAQYCTIKYFMCKKPKKLAQYKYMCYLCTAKQKYQFYYI